MESILGTIKPTMEVSWSGYCLWLILLMRGKRKRLYRQLRRTCTRWSETLMEKGRRQQQSFWDTLNDYCLPCVEVCRIFTPSIRVTRHLKYILFLPCLLLMSCFYMKTESETRLQMMAEPDQQFWIPQRFLNGIIRWQTVEEPSPAAPTPLQVLQPDCEALFSGDPIEVSVTREMVYKETRKYISDNDIKDLYRNCSYPDGFSFINSTEGGGGEVYPIAYLMYVKHSAEQLLSVLRAIYRRENLYCLYSDPHTSNMMQGATENIAKCYKNILFVKAKPGEWAFDAQRVCLEELVTYSSAKWQHLIHISDQHFPLVDSHHIMSSLREQSELIEIPWIRLTHIQKYHYFLRTQHAFNASKNREQSGEFHQVPNVLQDITLYRGDYNFLVTRQFIQYALYDKAARILANWTKSFTQYPDIVFWPTLYMASRFYAERTTTAFLVTKQPLAGDSYHRNCVVLEDPECVFGVEDLSWLSEQQKYFASRFDLDVDHLALRCLDIRLEKISKLRNKYSKEFNHSNTIPQMVYATN